MDIPEYVSKEEVKRVCDQLNFRDWTILPTAEVELREAEILRELVAGEALDISVKSLWTNP